MAESVYEMAERHVREQERRIEKQKRRIERLSEIGADTSGAENLLVSMRDLLRVMETDLLRLRASK